MKRHKMSIGRRPAALLLPALALAAGGLLASCSSEDPVPGGVSGSGSEIKFSPVLKTNSRALVTTTFGTEPNSTAISDFAVYAEVKVQSSTSWLTNMGNPGAALLKRKSASKPGDSPLQNWEYAWEYDAANTAGGAAAAWPDAGKIDFYALSPSAIKGLKDTAGTAAESGLGAKAASALFGADDAAVPNHTLSYTVPNDFANQQDVLVARTPDVSSFTHVVVPLRFQHVLSRVTAAVRMSKVSPDMASEKDHTYYIIKGLSFLNFHASGKLPLKADDISTGHSTGIPGSTAGTEATLGFTYDTQKPAATVWKTTGGATEDFTCPITAPGIKVSYWDGTSFATPSGITPPTSISTGPNSATDGYVSLFDTGQALMVLPQVLPHGTEDASELCADTANDPTDGAYIKLTFQKWSDAGGTGKWHNASATDTNPDANSVKYIPICNYEGSYGDDKQGFYKDDFVFEIGRQYRFLIDMTEQDDGMYFRVIVSDYDNAGGVDITE